MDRHIAIQLARLTTQSSGCEPSMPGGGIPELTTADVAACAAQIRNPNAYNAVMAKYCEHDISIRKLEKHTTDYCWILWLQQGHKAVTSAAIHESIARVSVEDYMNPAQAIKRGDDGRANACDMSRSTWVKKYSQHYKGVTAYLFNLESEAQFDIKRAMR